MEVAEFVMIPLLTRIFKIMIFFTRNRFIQNTFIHTYILTNMLHKCIHIPIFVYVLRICIALKVTHLFVRKMLWKFIRGVINELLLFEMDYIVKFGKEHSV